MLWPLHNLMIGDALDNKRMDALHEEEVETDEHLKEDKFNTDF